MHPKTHIQEDEGYFWDYFGLLQRLVNKPLEYEVARDVCVLLPEAR